MLLDLNASLTALVVIDVQKDFFESQPRFAFHEQQKLLSPDDLSPMQEMVFMSSYCR